MKSCKIRAVAFPLALCWLGGWCDVFEPPVPAQSTESAPARIVTEYALTSAYSREFADPRNWRLQASSDGGESWVTLDVRTNQVFTRRSQRLVYSITNQTAYCLYRLQVDKASSVHLAELELLGPVVGVRSEQELRSMISSSCEEPLLGPAADAFDNDPTTRWVDLGRGGRCWIQCQYSRHAEVVVTNVSQLLIKMRRITARNPLRDKAPQILSNIVAQASRPVRVLAGYALTSANDVPDRDPRDWALLGSNDGGKNWDTLDVRENESFATRFQKRRFALAKPASYGIYRLRIDSVRVPAGPTGGATCVQLAEIEPEYAGNDPGGRFSIVVSAQGENPPLEIADAAFDGDAKSKWLDFAETFEGNRPRANTNRASWIQWQYVAGVEAPLINLRWLGSVRARAAEPIQLRVEGVAVSWNPETHVLGFLDDSGFQFLQLGPGLSTVPVGHRIQLSGRLGFDSKPILVSEPTLVSFDSVPGLAQIQAQMILPDGPVFFAGATEGKIESMSEAPGQLVLKLRPTDGPGFITVRILEAKTNRAPALAGCRLRAEGVLEPAFNSEGKRIPGILWVSEPEQLSLLPPPGSEWNKWPVFSIEKLSRTNTAAALGQRVRVIGTVQQAGTGYITLTENGAQMIVRCREPAAAHVGDSVEAIGLLDQFGALPAVRLACVRPAMTGPPPLVAEEAPTKAVRRMATNISSLVEWTQQNPNGSFQVKLRGVITYIALDLNGFYLQDGADAVQIFGVFGAGLSPFLRQEGRYAEVRGTYSPQDRAVTATSLVSLLGRGQMPEPAHHSWDYLMSGKDFNRWIEIEGLVRQVEQHRLVLIVNGGKLVVWINELDKAQGERLLGSIVRVCGVCEPVLNQRNSPVGFRLMVPSTEQVQIVRPFPEQPFSLRLRPLHELMGLANESTNQVLQLVKTEGIVTFQGPHFIFLQDGSDGVRVSPRSDFRFEPGDRVQVVGFPEPDGFSPKLIQAQGRRIGRTKLPEANPIDVLGTELESQDATRGQLEAMLLGSRIQDGAQILELQDAKGVRTFSAFFSTNHGLLPPIPVGSQVRLQGVFKAETDPLPDYGQVISSFQMYANSPADLVLLKRPVWWRARYALWIVLAAGGMLLLALAWAGSLRKQVLQRTQTLRAEIAERQRAELALRDSEAQYHSLVDSLPQNILRKNLEGRFTFVNAFFCRTLGKSREEVLGKTDFDLYPRELATKFRADDDAVIDSGKLLQVVESNRDSDGQETYVEVIKTPLYDAERRPLGLLVIFWDVTARQQAQAKLEEVHKQLLETSRQAGMAEVATSVLHNVGNVLNSVNVSTTLLIEQLNKSKMGSLSQAVGLLREHESQLADWLANDPKGRQLPGYLGRLAEHLAAEQSAALEELTELARNIDHIKDIVSMQQSYAKVAGVAERVQLPELLEDALRMNSAALLRHEVKLVREYDPKLPEITVEKHKVLQILVNLVRNAKYACDESGRPDKQLTLRVHNGNGRLKVSIIDNGVGIPPEHLTRIFNLGFTTRKDGHGFGLHSGALAAREMGGALRVHSDGPGRGATFTLELPVSLAT